MDDEVQVLGSVLEIGQVLDLVVGVVEENAGVQLVEGIGLIW